MTAPMIPVPLHDELAPWLAALLPVQAFPMTAAERYVSATMIAGLHQLLLASSKLHLHLYLQSWKLMGNRGADILNDHLSSWWPVIGCGVWPDREPPRAWTEERLSDSAAALFTGDEVPLMNHKLFRLSVETAQRPLAAETIQGFGGLLELFSAAETPEWEKRLRERYLPTITEKRFRNEKFYVPLIDRASLAATRTASALDASLAGASVCLRESAEDKGVLLLWRSDRLPQIAGWLQTRYLS